MYMEYGRDHDEREQKFGTRIDEELSRGSGDEVEELDRRAKSTDPAPTKKAQEEERARHAREGTTGGNVGPKLRP
ncbi:MAG: hypothetical protein JWN44_6768 [Myxococcales bacterium]|nr:hypothetical protein [Myxococcales bacterium]